MRTLYFLRNIISHKEHCISKRTLHLYRTLILFPKEHCISIEHYISLRTLTQIVYYLEALSSIDRVQLGATVSLEKTKLHSVHPI
jgi:hypothetical protein